MKILIVDDDLVDREHITRVLNRSDIECHITDVGRFDDALVKLKNLTFDVVLLDYNLPLRNGIDLLIELKADPTNSNTAVIMISTSSEDELAIRCINAGAQDFLIKTEINVFRLQRAIANAQARNELEKKLFQSYKQTKQLAEKDSLTGLANRYFFDESLVNNIKHNLRNTTTLALLLIDLDHFKYVNDTYGHDIGDQLLVKVVERIQTTLRGNELFARLGGDEFAIILNDLTSINSAILVAQRVNNLLSELFEIGRHSIQSGASIGISICPWDSGDEKVLFKYADIAMYRAKSMGRNQFAFFEEEMQVKFLADFNMENKLRKAVANNEFVMKYQPVIDALTKKLMGVEALIRWQCDEQAVEPDQFIPIAEKSRLIVDIGKWVIQHTIEQLSIWNNRTNLSLTMAINLSAMQLTYDNLIIDITNSLEQHNVAANLIEFEITETALIVDPEKTASMIQKISDLGCKVSLDDFGTGFSSLSHLHSFPIDIVKIDKSLIPNAASMDKIKNIFQGVILMVKSLKLEIVAEGVETLDEFNLCLELKIEKVQGYFFDKPLSPLEFENKYLR